MRSQSALSIPTSKTRAEAAGLDTLLDAFIECVSVDGENDAVADRDTPVLE